MKMCAYTLHHVIIHNVAAASVTTKWLSLVVFFKQSNFPLPWC